jgi:hypothetical protein
MSALSKVRRRSCWEAFMSESLLSRLVGEERSRARKACAELSEATAEAGCVLPSLGVEGSSVISGMFLVQLGGVAPKTAERLAEVIRAGLAALAAEEIDGAVADLRAPVRNVPTHTVCTPSSPAEE